MDKFVDFQMLNHFATKVSIFCFGFCVVFEKDPDVSKRSCRCVAGQCDQRWRGRAFGGAKSAAYLLELGKDDIQVEKDKYFVFISVYFNCLE